MAVLPGGGSLARAR